MFWAMAYSINNGVLSVMDDDGLMWPAHDMMDINGEDTNDPLLACVVVLQLSDQQWSPVVITHLPRITFN